MIDIVIPLIAGGSRHNDLELRYCLRSIEKYVSGYRDIYIMGHLPSWVDPKAVKHIPCKELPKKQASIRNKIVLAWLMGASHQLLFFNDDHFILEPFVAAQLPFYYDGDLSNASEKACLMAAKELRAKGYPTKHFDIHVPIVYNKTAFFDPGVFSDEASIKSTYANSHHSWIDGEKIKELKDLKINSNLSYQRIRQEIRGRFCFSVGDYGINRNMKQILEELYPEPSRYELR